MRHLVMLSAVLLGLGLMAGPAAALPAPMSERAAAKERPGGAGPHQVRHLHRCHQGCRTGEDLPSYSASAELMEVIKGEEVKGDTVNIIFHAIATGLLGPWTVYYYPGEMVWTHLVGKRIHHHLVERPRQRREPSGHHRAADQARRDSRDTQERKVA